MEEARGASENKGRMYVICSSVFGLNDGREELTYPAILKYRVEAEDGLYPMI